MYTLKLRSEMIFGPPRGLLLLYLIMSTTRILIWRSEMCLLMAVGAGTLFATMVPNWLKLEVEGMILNEGVEDFIIWKNAINGVYSASSACHCLTQACLPTAPLLGTGSWVWKLHVLENIKIFLWLSSSEQPHLSFSCYSPFGHWPFLL